MWGRLPCPLVNVLPKTGCRSVRNTQRYFRTDSATKQDADRFPPFDAVSSVGKCRHNLLCKALHRIVNFIHLIGVHRQNDVRGTGLPVGLNGTGDLRR